MMYVMLSDQKFVVNKITWIAKGSIPKYTEVNVTHPHDDELIFVQRGTCKYKIEGKDFYADPGNVIWITKNARYSSLTGCDEYKTIHCDFEFSFEDGYMTKSDIFESNAIICNLFTNLQLSFARRENYTVYRTFYDILGNLAEIEKEKLKYRREHSIELERRISESCRTIELSISNPNLSVAMLSGQALMSETYYRRIFKRYLGMQPSQYIINERVRVAKILLSHDYITMEMCSKMCGFTSMQYFSHAFRAETGMSPTEYRQLIFSDTPIDKK